MMKAIYRRIKAVFSLIKKRDEFVYAKTYYPECELKSKFTIFLEQFYIIMKYGNYEPFYFTYGFDRKAINLKSICSEFIIPYYKFQHKINTLNTINPIYGKYNGRTITADKFYFGIFLEKYKIPTPQIYCYIRKGRILYISDNLNHSSSENDIEKMKAFFKYDIDAFAKPADGQLGIGVFSLKVNDGIIYKDGSKIAFDDLMKIILSGDYLIQERIVQHPKMSALCSSTLNSIRLQTVMTKEGDIVPFAPGLRMGREGSSVDNWAKGGIFVGIDMKTGKLFEKGFIKPKYGTSTKFHLDSKIVFKDYEIPFFHQAVQYAIELHKKMYRCHSIGWDIAITENGPVFIEGNGLWEISLLQAAHGGLKEIEQYFI